MHHVPVLPRGRTFKPSIFRPTDVTVEPSEDILVYVHMQGYVNACTSIFLVWHIELLFRRRPNFHFPDAVVLPTSARLKPGGCSNSGLKADRHQAGSLDRVSILRLCVGNLVPYWHPLVRSLASRISRNDFRPTAVQSALHARDNSEHLGTHRTCIRSTPCILCLPAEICTLSASLSCPITPYNN